LLIIIIINNIIYHYIGQNTCATTACTSYLSPLYASSNFPEIFGNVSKSLEVPTYIIFIWYRCYSWEQCYKQVIFNARRKLKSKMRRVVCQKVLILQHHFAMLDWT